MELDNRGFSSRLIKVKTRDDMAYLKVKPRWIFSFSSISVPMSVKKESTESAM